MSASLDGATSSVYVEQSRFINLVRDLDVDGVHSPQGEYVETAWLPVIGPTSLLLLRRMDRALGYGERLDRQDTMVLAACIGVGHKGGRHSPMTRALERLAGFRMLRRDGDDVLVPRRVPNVPDKHIERMPPALQAMLRAWR